MVVLSAIGANCPSACKQPAVPLIRSYVVIPGNGRTKTITTTLDVTGRYFVWTTNLGGNRLDAFIVKIPVSTITP
jgi:hypothetical protein